MDTILEPLLRSSRLPEYVNQLNAYMQAEHVRRLAFREWLDEDKKAEFINGQVIMHSPTRFGHNETRQRISRTAQLHALSRAIGKVIDEKATIGLERNDYMPDVCFWRTEIATPISPDQQLMPVPDFVCEVLSDTTEKFDRGQKFHDYASAGIGEYWIVDYEARTVEQYLLEGKEYSLAAKLKPGEVIESRAIAGFRLPVEAIFDDEANLAAIRALMR